MKLLNGIVKAERVTNLVPLTLDDLWAEASRLGDVSLGRELFGSLIAAEIKFKRPSGSTVWAKATDQDPRLALQKAIEEARAIAGKEAP